MSGSSPLSVENDEEGVKDKVMGSVDLFAAPQVAIGAAHTTETKLNAESDFPAEVQRSVNPGQTNVPNQTLIFLDWDDTLCPTSGCMHLMQTLCLSALEKEMLRAHEVAVIDFLRCAAELGHCAIVTMAVTSWVSQCITKLMPGVNDVLEDLHIEVIHNWCLAITLNWVYQMRIILDRLKCV